MYIDIKYLNLISSQLPLFKKKNDYTLNFKLNRGTDEQLEYAKQWYLAGYKHMNEQYPDGKYPWIK